MKVYLFIGFSLLVISLITYFIGDSKHELIPFKPQSVCLRTSDSNKLCAQCFKRDQKFHRNKGIRIQSNQPVGLLKIADKQTYLTCQEYLQLISIQESRHKKLVSLQLLPAVTQLLSQIHAVYSSKAKTDEVVQPWYHEFVIYKLGDTLNRETSVTFPNPQNYRKIHFYFLVVFNFILLFLSLFLLADMTQISSQSTQSKIFLFFIVLFLEFCLMEIKEQICLYLCRLLVLNIGFFRLNTGKAKRIVIFAAGLFLAYFQATLLAYVSCIILLLSYYGGYQQEQKQIKHYFLCFYSVFLANHIYVYSFVNYLNDFRNLTIDLCLIISVPLGLVILAKPKSAENYHPIASSGKASQLNEFEFQQPTQI